MEGRSATFCRIVGSAEAIVHQVARRESWAVRSRRPADRSVWNSPISPASTRCSTVAASARCTGSRSTAALSRSTARSMSRISRWLQTRPPSRPMTPCSPGAGCVHTFDAEPFLLCAGAGSCPPVAWRRFPKAITGLPEERLNAEQWCPLTIDNEELFFR